MDSFDQWCLANTSRITQEDLYFYNWITDAPEGRAWFEKIIDRVWLLDWSPNQGSEALAHLEGMRSFVRRLSCLKRGLDAAYHSFVNDNEPQCDRILQQFLN